MILIRYLGSWSGLRPLTLTKIRQLVDTEVAGMDDILADFLRRRRRRLNDNLYWTNTFDPGLVDTRMILRCM